MTPQTADLIRYLQLAVAESGLDLSQPLKFEATGQADPADDTLGGNDPAPVLGQKIDIGEMDERQA